MCQSNERPPSSLLASHLSLSPLPLHNVTAAYIIEEAYAQKRTVDEEGAVADAHLPALDPTGARVALNERFRFDYPLPNVSRHLDCISPTHTIVH